MGITEVVSKSDLNALTDIIRRVHDEDEQGASGRNLFRSSLVKIHLDLDPQLCRGHHRGTSPVRTMSSCPLSAKRGRAARLVVG